MEKHSENCMVCGKPLVYSTVEQAVHCYVCGLSNATNTLCEDAHFVCDACHAEKGILAITLCTKENPSKNPIEIATGIMKNPDINMHGPEHHYLVPASLLAAYKNAGGEICLDTALQTARQRSQKVPGGICGLWGSCGAGIGTGIFISVITGATPLSGKEWSLANLMTSKSLATISENGGPRCCKRNTYLAISQSAAFVRKHFGVAMELPERIVCESSHRNNQCRGNNCLFSPVRG